MQQDLELFAPLTDDFLFISTDWVYEPALRRYPQPVENSPYITSDRNGAEAYGWGKLMAENYLREHAPQHLNYTIFRPCHIYGMPSELGCFPGHCRDKELIAKLLKGETLELVDNGRLLQQPIDCDDLAKTMISIFLNAVAVFIKGRCTDAFDFAAGKSRFEKIGGIHGTFSVSGADDGVKFVNKQDDPLSSADFFDDFFKPFLKFSAEF